MQIHEFTLFVITEGFWDRSASTLRVQEMIVVVLTVRTISLLLGVCRMRFKRQKV